MDKKTGFYNEYSNKSIEQLQLRLDRINIQLEAFPKDDRDRLTILLSELDKAKKAFNASKSIEDRKAKNDVANKIMQVNHDLFTLDLEARALRQEISTRNAD